MGGAGFGGGGGGEGGGGGVGRWRVLLLRKGWVAPRDLVWRWRRRRRRREREALPGVLKLAPTCRWCKLIRTAVVLYVARPATVGHVGAVPSHATSRRILAHTVATSREAVGADCVDLEPRAASAALCTVVALKRPSHEESAFATVGAKVRRGGEGGARVQTRSKRRRWRRRRLRRRGRRPAVHRGAQPR